MKRISRFGHFGALAAGIVSLVLFLSAPAIHADDHHGCSLHGVAGTWGYRLAGSFLTDPASPTYPNDVPWAGVGTFSLDKNGNVTGSGPLNGGGVGILTFSGTYTVDSDCTGTLTIDVLENGVDQGIVHFSLVFVENSREVHWVSTEPEFVINIDGKRLFND